MKKVERKKKPLVKEIPKRYGSISSLSSKKSDYKKDLNEGNSAITKDTLRKVLDETQQQYDPSPKHSMTVIEEILPPVVQSFVPLLYNFRLPGGSRSSLAETPPFWLLLDHAVGVIWALFSPEQKSKLGVSDLHWALEFLKGIKPSRGEHPKDVKLCINAIEDKLIELFAKTTSKTDEAIESSSSATIVTGSGLRKMSGSMISLGKYMDNMGRRSSVLSTSGKTTPAFPLSVTYEEILHRRPRSVQQLYKAEPKKFYGNEGVIVEEDVDLRPSKSNVSVPYNKMVEFLTDWRREQVERIQNELKRLHSIEAFMKALEKEDFQPFIDGQLPQKLSEMKSNLSPDIPSRDSSVAGAKRTETSERI
ncbi:hypothetical protein L9F63_013755 [Diploptera punctata]|uniref:Uncharacterized protein n=1 Tax=Diploptera punctata TaxID=6984 RepID=A0AAD8A9H0_DIPPU|nr:hypothetical protein L9F63_013755 [Diploptera punctata]